MSENLSFIIILEFVAPFAILSIVLLLALLNSNKKNKKGLSKLLTAVQGGEESYKQKLQEFLKKSGTPEEQIDELVQKFCKSRRAFFKRALSAISNSDAELLTGLGGQFGVFSDLYHQLSISATASTTEDDADEEQSEGSESRDELEATYKVVKRENKRLKAEVHVSVSALNSLFGEYASMFGETDNSKSDMSVQEVLDAMEKFTKGDFKPDNITGDIPPEDAAAEKQQQAAEEALDAKLEDIVVEDTETLKAEDQEAEKTQEEEPNWDEAFEETGDIPDEAAMEQLKQAEQAEVETAEVETAEEVAVTEEEPSWDEAFEETGDTPDEAAVEQVNQAEQESQSESPSKSAPDEAKDPKNPPKSE